MLDYDIISTELLNAVSKKAATSQRKRMNHNFHQLADTVQRMLNAIEPGSYLRPHRHIDPPKTEAFILLHGDISIVIFDDHGNITECIRCNKKTGNYGADIRPGAWHTIVSHATGSVIFEVKNGPYIPATDKDFAPWAPAENSPEVHEYLRVLIQKIELRKKNTR